MPPLPALAAHLWKYYADPVTGLAGTRRNTGMGPSRLTRQEIHDWERDEGVSLDRWERRAILAIDAAWVISASPKT